MADESNIPYDSSDEGQVKRRKRQCDKARDQEVSDLGKIMGCPEGRRFVWRLLNAAGVFRISFDRDPYVTAFREGERNNGLSLLADVQAFYADRYTIMVTEAKNMEAEKNG